MSQSKLRYGLIGLGGINQVHVWGYQQVSERAQIVAVCDVNETVAHQRANTLECVAYTDYRRMLDEAEIDVVDVTLPHNLHYPVVRAALERGKHVLVEKPMATRASQCRELVDLARANNVKFTVAENTRFVTAYLAAAKLIEDGVLGEPRLIRTLIYGSAIRRLKNTNDWKGKTNGSGGGVIVDSGPHSFYLLKWLFGEIDWVRAFESKFVQESEVEDHAVVSGQLKSGSLFSTEYTFISEIPWGERMEIYGAKGSLIVDQLANPPALHYRGGQDYEPVALGSVPYDPKRWKVHSIAGGVRDFVDAVYEDRAPAVDPEDGAYAIQVVESAYASVAADGRPMKVSPGTLVMK